jgi:hypothetical protein
VGGRSPDSGKKARFEDGDAGVRLQTARCGDWPTNGPQVTGKARAGIRLSFDDCLLTCDYNLVMKQVLIIQSLHPG